MKYLIALTALMLIPSVSFANEDALYAPAPPADSAFVRTINATGNVDTVITINNNALNTDNGSEIISDYGIFKEGAHKVAFADKNEEINLDAGKYYTIAVAPDNKIKVYEDALIENPTKATVYFCNFTEKATTLKSDEFEATLFENTDTLLCDSREMNAVDFDLKVVNGDVQIKDFPKVSLKRQMGTSIIVMNDETYLIENKVYQ